MSEDIYVNLWNLKLQLLLLRFLVLLLNIRRKLLQLGKILSISYILGLGKHRNNNLIWYASSEKAPWLSMLQMNRFVFGCFLSISYNSRKLYSSWFLLSKRFGGIQLLDPWLLISLYINWDITCVYYSDVLAVSWFNIEILCRLTTQSCLIDLLS